MKKLFFLLFILAFFNCKAQTEKHDNVDSILNVIQITVVNNKIKDSIREIKEQKDFEKSKAYKIWKKHPEWSRQDCYKIANKKYWIGMTDDMLFASWGHPTSSRQSNYGDGVEYQYCYFTVICFYVKNGKVTSWN